MQNESLTDYETYREIMGELLRPIEASGLDADTLKRLYESKLVYLENLRVKIFVEVNGGRAGHFTMPDYELVLKAIEGTHSHLRELVLLTMASQLKKRRAAR